MEQGERDLDVAIERLVNLRLDAAAEHDSDIGSTGAHHDGVVVHPATATAADEEEARQQHTTVVVNVPSGGIDDDRAELIDRLVSAVACSESWDDASARAAKLLEEFDVALRQNDLLKKAVRMLHRLGKEQEAANRELQQQLAGCQERVRGLETENYALSMYLRNAQPKPQGGSITGRFHPEVF